MSNRTRKTTSWAVPLLLLALLVVSGIAGGTASALGVWS